jgi:beta-phosphoglucomutase family hydrolase
VAPIDWTRIDAALFDLDGVLTPTAVVHESAWKRSFDSLLRDRDGEGFEPFTQSDYLAHVDGKPRYDGVADFLASRGIELPRGEPSDDPGFETVCALGNLKNQMFNQVLDDEGVDPYPDALVLLDALASAGKRMAIVSSSANAKAVLAAAGLSDRFLFVMDGAVARERSIPGKPAPDMFLGAASEVSVDPSRAVVFEDAVSGVAAGAAGGFAEVVGVDRTGAADALTDAGATLITDDLLAVCPG